VIQEQERREGELVLTRDIFKLTDEEQCKKQNNRLTFKKQKKDEPGKSHTYHLKFDPPKKWI